MYRAFFWFFVALVFLLGWIGQMPVEEPYLTIGQVASGLFFVYFLVLIPALGPLEDGFLREFAKNLMCVKKFVIFWKVAK